MISAGAKSRWANVFMGLLVGFFVFFFGDQVEKVAAPAIAAVLIVAGSSIFNFEEIKDIWDVSRSSRVVLLVTFLATLTLEIQEAVFLGIVVSIMDFVYTSAQDIQVVELVRGEGGNWLERPAPRELAGDQVTVLFAWGALFFASARTLEDLLPKVDSAQQAVVILRLHGRSRIGSTFIQVLERYAGQLEAGGGKLILAGVGQHVLTQLARTETFEAIPQEDIFPATDRLGQATEDAMAAAELWLMATTAAD